MKTIKTEVRYNKMSFKFIREFQGLRMFFNEEQDYCIIVNIDDTIIFEISADCGHGMGFLRDEG